MAQPKENSMKISPSLALLASSLVAATPAVASDVPMSEVHLCTLHYSKLAYGKPVRSVMAHTGTQACALDGRMYWDGVQDVALAAATSGDRLTGKVVLKARTSAYRPCSLNPVVQFWVTFEDGSTKIEDVVAMKVGKRFRANDISPIDTAEEAKTAVEAFLKSDVIDTVACFAVWSYGDGALEFADLALQGDE
jgi:hypothetical protein